MELIFLAGLSIPALTLTLLMVSFYQSVKRVDFWYKKPKMSKTHTIENKKTIATEENSDFKHIDFSGGWLGI